MFLRNWKKKKSEEIDKIFEDSNYNESSDYGHLIDNSALSGVLKFKKGNSVINYKIETLSDSEFIIHTDSELRLFVPAKDIGRVLIYEDSFIDPSKNFAEEILKCIGIESIQIIFHSIKIKKGVVFSEDFLVEKCLSIISNFI